MHSCCRSTQPTICSSTKVHPSIQPQKKTGNGQFAPGNNLGDAGRYSCGHNLLLAHAAAAALYRSKYRAAQNGRLSFSTLITWAEPAGGAGAAADAAAAQNKLDADVGWFLDPIMKGDYPASLRAAKGAAIPKFTPEQAAQLRGSLDFLAVNCFSAKWVFAPGGGGESRGAWKESKTHPATKSAIGPSSGISWIDVVPWSQERALKYIQKQYGDPQVTFGWVGFAFGWLGALGTLGADRWMSQAHKTSLCVSHHLNPAQILISSSGVMGPGEATAPAAQQLQDTFRLDYYKVSRLVAWLIDMHLRLWNKPFAASSVLQAPWPTQPHQCQPPQPHQPHQPTRGPVVPE